MKRKRLTHLAMTGEARMVDISAKAETDRIAVATAMVRISRELLGHLTKNTLAKGDALAAARIAGIQAAKKTAELIPLCHPLLLTFVSVDVELTKKPPSVKITAKVRTKYRTGVEMEAMTAASVAALTIYDMGKSVDRDMTIECVRLEEKSGGRSGSWKRPRKG